MLHWIITVTAFLLWITLSEHYWRRQGFCPSVSDTKEFWCQSRSNVYGTGPRRVLVIAGKSRAQLGLVPEVIETEMPGIKVIQLTIDGTSPWNVVADLCRDEGFNGILLVSDLNSSMKKVSVPNVDRASEYLTYYYRNFAPDGFVDKRLNTAIGGRLQSGMAILSADLSFQTLCGSGFHVKPPYIAMLANRYRPARYLEGMAPEELTRHRELRVQSATRDTRLFSQRQFEIGMGSLQEMHETLLRRGGEMVMVRMPTTAEHWEADQKRAPKFLFWDRITGLSGVPTIHFADYEVLRSFDCPDTSHLDASDAPEFTRRLVHVLRAKLDL
jgi:hypothetical protein